MVISFPEANASRIKSISKKYAEEMLSSDLYSIIDFNYELMFKSIDRLVGRNITSLRKHQQMIEAVLENALDVALVQEDNSPVPVTESMFAEAEQAILGTAKRTSALLHNLNGALFTIFSRPNESRMATGRNYSRNDGRLLL